MKKAYLKLLSGTFVAVLLALSPANGEEENLLLNPSFENNQTSDILNIRSPDNWVFYGDSVQAFRVRYRHPINASAGESYAIFEQTVDEPEGTSGYYQDVASTAVGKIGLMSFDAKLWNPGDFTGHSIGLEAYDSEAILLASATPFEDLLTTEYARYEVSLVIPDDTAFLRARLEGAHAADPFGRRIRMVFDNFHLSIVPEPSTYAAIIGALALAGVVFMRRRRA